jgi:hypothetical protein
VPKFTPKPVAVRGHKVRYEDVHLEEPQAEEWVLEALENGTIHRRHSENALGIEQGGDFYLAKLGTWIMQRQDGSLFCLTQERLALDYDLVGGIM